MALGPRKSSGPRPPTVLGNAGPLSNISGGGLGEGAGTSSPFPPSAKKQIKKRGGGGMWDSCLVSCLFLGLSTDRAK
jgi:hypothetical protein